MGKVIRGYTLRAWTMMAATALLVVGGCAAEPVTSASAAPAPLSEQVLTVGLNRIAEIYLQPVDLAKLCVDGLAGLRTIDPMLRIVHESGAVTINRGNRQVTAFAIPENGDPGVWAMLTTRAVERARQFSPPLYEATPDQLYQAVFDGVLADLDSYSRYTTPQRASNERVIREGYGGVGLALESRNGRYLVREVSFDGPADRSGIAVGEAVDAIDGAATRSMTAQEITEALRGIPGSVVRLTVAPLRGGPGAGRMVSLHRERVISNSVQARIDNGVVIVKVERFNAATTANLRDTLELILARLGHNARGVVLDLRGNPGGLLDQAVAVADLFIRRGRVVSTAGRHPDSWQRFDAIGEDILNDRPLVVLIDGRSASAAEIVAAALQDSGRAVVVGASSFGKGSVQTVTRLPNDGELFLTWSRIYAPSGYTLHRQGVQPTVCTSHDDADAETVLAPLRSGQIEAPGVIARWRAAAPDDEAALARLRQACPWKAHEAELDVRVAERLLAVPTLYRSALALSTTAVAER
ncbi:MAG: S41 family peptidase [Rhodospirillaceae bacterium]